MDAASLFRERQRFHHGGVGRLILVASVVALVAVAVIPASRGAASELPGLFGLAIGGSVVALLFCCELRVVVRPDALHVRFFPLTRQHRYSWDEIESAQARTYRPIAEFGGWGVRFGRRGKAYNVYGNRGVQLELTGGRRLLIGSQRADELAAAIRSARGAGSA